MSDGTIYAGETATFDIDLDASVLDPDYPLSGLTLAARVTAPGKATSICEATVEAVDSAAGKLAVTIDATTLPQGIVHLFVEATNPLTVLAQKVLTVSYRAGAVGAQPENENTVTFGKYLAFCGGVPLIPEDRYPRFKNEAVRLFAEVTRGAAIAGYEAQATEAICRAAEVLYRLEEYVASEKVGGYSVTYANIPTRSDAISAIRSSLAGTGLLYRGISVWVPTNTLLGYWGF